MTEIDWIHSKGWESAIDQLTQAFRAGITTPFVCERCGTPHAAAGDGCSVCGRGNEEEVMS